MILLKASKLVVLCPLHHLRKLTYKITMATVTRYSVAKTQRSYTADGVNVVKGSTVFSSTQDLRDSYVNPAPNYARLNPTT